MLIKNSVHEHLVEIKVILNLKILFLLCLSIAEQKSFEWLSGDNSSAQITLNRFAFTLVTSELRKS